MSGCVWKSPQAASGLGQGDTGGDPTAPAEHLTSKTLFSFLMEKEGEQQPPMGLGLTQPDSCLQSGCPQGTLSIFPQEGRGFLGTGQVGPQLRAITAYDAHQSGSLQLSGGKVPNSKWLKQKRVSLAPILETQGPVGSGMARSRCLNNVALLSPALAVLSDMFSSPGREDILQCGLTSQ